MDNHQVTKTPLGQERELSASGLNSDGRKCATEHGRIEELPLPIPEADPHADVAESQKMADSLNNKHSESSLRCDNYSIYQPSSLEKHETFNSKAGDSLERQQSFRTNPLTSFARKGTFDFSGETTDAVSHTVTSSKNLSDPIDFDPDKPNDWVLAHHRDGLVSVLQPPALGSREYLMQKLRPSRKSPSNEADEKQAEGKHDESRLRISFVEVQRMRIRKLQCKIVREVMEMRRTGKDSEMWENNLKEYTQALRDYDYMSECGKRARDPFLATGEFWVDRYIIERNLRRRPCKISDLTKIQSDYAWQYGQEDCLPIPGTRRNEHERSASQNFQKRLSVAAMGGTFLVGPMWLMVLQTWKYTPLITTTLMVTLFGLIMAKILKEEKDVLASTAAYAAVLVVFVGVNSSPAPRA